MPCHTATTKAKIKTSLSLSLYLSTHKTSIKKLFSFSIIFLSVLFLYRNVKILLFARNTMFSMCVCVCFGFAYLRFLFYSRRLCKFSFMWLFVFHLFLHAHNFLSQSEIKNKTREGLFLHYIYKYTNYHSQPNWRINRLKFLKLFYQLKLKLKIKFSEYFIYFKSYKTYKYNSVSFFWIFRKIKFYKTYVTS